MNDLKPCPFCGQIPELKILSFPHVTAWRVCCMNDACGQPYLGDYNNPVIAVNAWNTRHDDKRKQDLLRDVHNLEIKLEELEKHLDEKNAIINCLVISLSGKAE